MSYMQRVQRQLKQIAQKREDKREARWQEAHAVCCRVEAAYKAAGWICVPRVDYSPVTGRYSLQGKTYTQSRILGLAEVIEARTASLVNPDDES